MSSLESPVTFVNTMEEIAAAGDCSAVKAEGARADTNPLIKEVNKIKISDNSSKDYGKIKEAEDNNVVNKKIQPMIGMDDQYSRQVLLSLHNNSLSLKRPCEIANEEIVRKEVNFEAIEMVDTMVNRVKLNNRDLQDLKKRAKIIPRNMDEALNKLATHDKIEKGFKNNVLNLNRILGFIALRQEYLEMLSYLLPYLHEPLMESLYSRYLVATSRMDTMFVLGGHDTHFVDLPSNFLSGLLQQCHNIRHGSVSLIQGLAKEDIPVISAKNMSFYKTESVLIRLHTTKLLKISCQENGQDLALCWKPDENSNRIKSINLEGNIQKLSPTMKTSEFQGDIIIELSRSKLIASIREPLVEDMTEEPKECYVTEAAGDHWKPNDIKVPKTEHEDVICKTLLYLSYHQLVDVVTNVHAILRDRDGMPSVIGRLEQILYEHSLLIFNTKVVYLYDVSFQSIHRLLDFCENVSIKESNINESQFCGNTSDKDTEYHLPKINLAVQSDENVTNIWYIETHVTYTREENIVLGSFDVKDKESKKIFHIEVENSPEETDVGAFTDQTVTLSWNITFKDPKNVNMGATLGRMVMWKPQEIRANWKEQYPRWVQP